MWFNLYNKYFLYELFQIKKLDILLYLSKEHLLDLVKHFLDYYDFTLLLQEAVLTTTEGSLLSPNASRAMEVKEKVALLYCFEQTYFVCIFHAEIFFSSIKTWTCFLSFYTIQPTKSAFPFFTFDGDSAATNILFSFF